MAHATSHHSGGSDQVNHDSLLGYVSGEHFLQSAISIPASQISDFDTEVSNNTDVTANTSARHSQSHVLDGADHTVSGLTPGHVLQALTATTFGFAAGGSYNSGSGITIDGSNNIDLGGALDANAEITSTVSSRHVRFSANSSSFSGRFSHDDEDQYWFGYGSPGYTGGYASIEMWRGSYLKLTNSTNGTLIRQIHIGASNQTYIIFDLH